MWLVALLEHFHAVLLAKLGHLLEEVGAALNIA
jgi:hypothetical protein